MKISTLIYESLCILKGITGEEGNGEGPLTRISSEIPFNLMHDVKKADLIEFNMISRFRDVNFRDK